MNVLNRQTLYSMFSVRYQYLVTFPEMGKYQNQQGNTNNGSIMKDAPWFCMLLL